MENRVRDLEQMEERDPEDRGRRIGTIVMATLGIVALTFAMGIVVGRAAEPSDESEKDPLDQLDRVASAAMKPSIAKAQQADEPLAKVEAAELSFPKSLTEDEDRPEVIAALEAAAREEKSLEQNAVEGPAEGSLEAAETIAQAVGAEAVKEQPVLDEELAQDDLRAEERVQAVLPASVAAGSASHQLVKAAKHDTLIANAMPSEAPRERAPHGEEGEYTLQVISYDAPGPAQAFASGLRAKGHEAFVASADVPDRGRYYRVRIGPFKAREKAEAYRRKFEDDEHMNTIVVRRPKDDGAAN